MNLAPLKYRPVLAEYGGPIHRIAIRELEATPTLPRRYESLAYLCEDLRSKEEGQVYGGADGTGTSTSPSVARFKAISEALERWAFHDKLRSAEAPRFGFDLEPSTTGMAAFAGLTSRPSRRLALFEAIERYSLSAWWEGLLPSEPLSRTRHGIRLNTPWTEAEIVITWNSKNPSAVTYGFAASRSIASAFEKAETERDRNERVLQIFNSSEKSDLEKLRRNERRLLHFASRAGHETFLARVASSLKLDAPVAAPRLIIDSRIPGPWDRYTTVWRCLFDAPSKAHQKSDPGYFLF